MDNGPVYALPAQAPPAGSQPLRALRLETGAGGFAVDDLFLFPRALSPAERTAIYQLGVRRFVTNLLANTTDDAWFEMEIVRLHGTPPQFLGQPQDLVRFEGESAGFRLSAVGTEPIAYQWLFNGVPIAGATQKVLYLDRVGLPDAGDYSLVASNVTGTVTSAPARLNVYGRPALEVLPRVGDNAWQVRLPQLPVAATLQVSTNLVDWEPVGTLAAGSPATNWSLPILPNRPAEFYRLLLHR
jgi:hypothetical protein